MAGGIEHEFGHGPSEEERDRSLRELADQLVRDPALGSRLPSPEGVHQALRRLERKHRAAFLEHLSRSKALADIGLPGVSNPQIVALIDSLPFQEQDFFEKTSRSYCEELRVRAREQGLL